LRKSKVGYRLKEADARFNDRRGEPSIALGAEGSPNGV